MLRERYPYYEATTTPPVHIDLSREGTEVFTPVDKHCQACVHSQVYRAKVNFTAAQCKHHTR